MIAFVWIACRPPQEPADVPDPPVTPDPTEDPSTPPADDGRDPIDDAPLFDPDHLVRVEVTMDPADWETLRFQTRDLFALFGGEGCLDAPFESPFTEFEADVTVDGEALARVGVSKKGLLGSMSSDKPSLKIDTDEFVDGQLLANGTERVVLNNVVQDPGYVNTCLGYRIFEDAGLPAPRCNFALVTVNGEDLGVYVHVEAVKKDFLARHFDDVDGDLYEGTLSDFVDGMTGTFEADTESTDPLLAPVHALTAALALPDDEVLDAVAALVDLDAFYRFWATESLVAHWDGYSSNTNNFFVYRDPSSDRTTFVPWGADALFGDPATPIAFTNGWLARRLWALPESREAYLAAMDEVLAVAFDEATLLAEIDRMSALISPHVADPATAAAVQDVARSFVSARRAVVEEGMAAADAIAVDLTPPDGEGWCLVDVGPLESTFETTWGTLDDDPFAGPRATIGSDLVEPLVRSGAIAGYDPYYGVPVLAVVGISNDWGDLYYLVVYPYVEIRPGVVPLDLASATALLVHYDLTVPYDEGTILGIVFGELVLDEVGTVDGAPVVGSITGELYEGLF